MLTVVCLSPCLDQTIELKRLNVGGTNRPLRSATVAGGKGLNVAMLLARAGRAVQMLTFRYAQHSETFMDAVRAAGISCVAIPAEGTLRTNLKLLDRQSDTVTEVNFPGAPVEERAAKAMDQAAETAAAQSDWLVLTGSMPSGYPADAYARMIRLARAANPRCRVALDAEGEALALGVAEKPDFVKPNRHELEMLTGAALTDGKAVAEAARKLAQSGVGAVCVSLDTDGAILADGQGVLAAGAVRVPVVTTVGAGDALVAGFVGALTDGRTNAEAFRAGIASATARVAGGVPADFLARVSVRSAAE